MDKSRVKLASPVRDYFQPPHGGRPPSDEAVHAATVRYVKQEKRGELRDLPREFPTGARW